MLEKLLEIDQVTLDFSDESKLLLNITIGFIMFGVALELKFDDFKKLFDNPKSVIIGIISQFLLMPLLTFVLALTLKSYITPTVGLGMILVASCPGGNVSNFISSLARGNVALSVSLTAFSSFAGLLLTPLNFTLWGSLFIKYYTLGNEALTIPTLELSVLDVLVTIFLIIGIPLLVGISCNYRFPKFTAKVLVPIKQFSILAFFGMIGVLFTKNLDLFLMYIKYIFLIVLAHNLLAILMGYNFAKILKLEFKERKTIAIETGIQNSGLALALLFNPLIFPQEMALGGMAFIAAWWGIWHIIAGLTIAGIWTGFKLKPDTISE